MVRGDHCVDAEQVAGNAGLKREYTGSDFTVEAVTESLMIKASMMTLVREGRSQLGLKFLVS